MEILVAVKRVPATGAKITLTADEQMIDTKHLAFTVSPHEECAVEEAVQIVKRDGGNSTVITLGPPDAEAQLRYAMAMGMDEAIHLVTGEDDDWGPIATSKALADAIQASDKSFDLLLFGNESADSGGYQVGIRVARALGIPCVTGIKALEFEDGKVIAKRETGNGWEIFEVPMPAMITVKEGINLPRYPSVPGRLRSRKKPIDASTPDAGDTGIEKIKLVVPQDAGIEVQILGNGPEAAPAVVDLLEEMGLLS